MNTVQFLAEWALRSSLLILIAALILRTVRASDPSIRLAAWTTVLCASLAIPALTVALPTLSFTMIHWETPRAVKLPAESLAAVHNNAPDVIVSPPDKRIEYHASRVPTAFDWARIALAIYILMAGVLLLRLCAGLAMSRRLLRGARATGLPGEGIEVLESDRVASPVSIGIARPAVVLPIDWREWKDARLDAVLAHERAHIRRRDPAVQLLSAIHRVLLWHSPLSWYLHRSLVRAAEDASDDAALTAILTHNDARASYAEMLLDFMQRGVRAATWQGVPMARYGRPAERINRILDGTSLSRGVTRWSVVAILALASPLAYVVSAAHPQSGAPAQTASPAPQAPAAPPAPAPTPPAPAVVPQAPDTQAPAPITKPKQAALAAPAAKKPLTFDAASVKPTTVPDGVQVGRGTRLTRKGSGIRAPQNTGGPGTDDPGRIHYGLTSLRELLDRAYSSYFDIKTPDWLDDRFFEVDATMPPDTTKEQFREMLANLLTDRFKLKCHPETKEVTGYALVVTRNGPKFKESEEVPAPPDQADGTRHRPQIGPEGPDGFRTLIPDGRPNQAIFSQSGRFKMVFLHQTMEQLAETLARRLKSPVTDATGLNGKYDFSMVLAGNLGRGGVAPSQLSAPAPGATEPVDADAPPDIFGALQSQLGLKLEPKKVNVQVMVVDHMEKTPSEN